jgi:hypothetical protein
LTCWITVEKVYLCIAFQAGRTLTRGLRGAYRLGNANNGDNAGSVYLNGNNAPSNANANYGVALNRSFHQEGEPSLMGEHR